MEFINHILIVKTITNLMMLCLDFSVLYVDRSEWLRGLQQAVHVQAKVSLKKEIYSGLEPIQDN